MSMTPTSLNQKIMRKMGISEIQVFTPKWKFVKKSEIAFVYWKQ